MSFRNAGNTSSYVTYSETTSHREKSITTWNSHTILGYMETVIPKLQFENFYSPQVHSFRGKNLEEGMRI